MGVKVGDQVLLPEFGGTKVELEDQKEYHLFRESDILAKIDSWDSVVAHAMKKKKWERRAFDCRILEKS